MHNVFIATLFTIAGTCRQPACPSVHGWVSKMWYIHTMEYNSSLKSKEILAHATTWMKLKDFMLSE